MEISSSWTIHDFTSRQKVSFDFSQNFSHFALCQKNIVVKETKRKIVGEFGKEKWIAYIMLLLFAGTSLVVVVNVNDSTMLKPALLFVGTAATAALWLTMSMRNARLLLPTSRLGLMFLAYVVISGLSLFNAMNLRLGMWSLAQLFCYFIAFCASMMYLERKKRVDAVLLVVTSIACLIGLYQAVGNSTIVTILAAGQRQTMSTFGNATYFAGFLVMMLPWIVSQAISVEHGIIRRMLLVVLVFVMFFLLVKTESRSSWIAATISLLLFGLMNFRTARTRWLVVAFIIGSGLIAYFLFPEIIQRRLGGLIGGSGNESVIRRFYFYEGAWKAFLASPVIGNGIGNFIVFLPKFRSPQYWMARAEDLVPHAHNEYLEVLSETGIIGACAFILFVTFVIITIIRSLWKTSGEQKSILIGFLCSIVAVLIDNLASLNLRVVPVAFGFWMIAGYAVSLSTSMTTQCVLLPGVFRRLQWLPVLAFIALTFWYTPKIFEQYEAEKNFLDGKLLQYRNQRQEASAKFEEVLLHNPHHAESRFFLTTNLLSSDIREAAHQATSILNEYPFFPKARLLLALATFQLGDTSKAFSLLEEQLALDDSPDALFYASSLAYRAGKENMEQTFLTRLLTNAVKSHISDHVTEIITRSASLSYNPQQLNDHAKLLDEIRTAFSTDPLILVVIGEWYERFGMTRQAEAIVAQALALHPTDPSITQRLKELEDRLFSSHQSR